MPKRKSKLKVRKRKIAKRPSVQSYGNLKTNIVSVEVDNPFFQSEHAESQGNRRRITAMLNMNESIAAHWWHKKLIEMPEYKAATRFRAYWEAAGGTGASALDYSIEKVDGGAQVDPVSVSRAQAVSELANIQLRLGRNGYELLVALCGECRPVADLWPSRRQQRKNSEECRALLKTLAIDFGYRKYVQNRARA